MKKQILFVLFIIGLAGCDTTREDLAEYYSDENYFQIRAYIRRYVQDQENYDKPEHFRYAINLLAKSKDSKSLFELEYICKTAKLNSIKLSVLDAFNEYNLVFEDYDFIIAEFVNSIHEDLVAKLKKMLLNYKDIEIYERTIQAFRKKSQKLENNSIVNKRLDDFLHEILNNNNGEEKYNKLVQKSRDLLSMDHKNKIQEAAVNKLQNEINLYTINIQMEIDRLQNQIKELKEQRLDLTVESIEAQEYLDQHKLFRLDAYIISQEMELDGGILYEIAPFYSENHAFLLTTQTKFTRKGSAQITVYQAGETKVKVKDGFNQDWKMYRQPSYEEQELISEYNKRLPKIKSEIKLLEEKIDPLKKSILEKEILLRCYPINSIDFLVTKIEKYLNSKVKSLQRQNRNERAMLGEWEIKKADLDNDKLEDIVLLAKFGLEVTYIKYQVLEQYLVVIKNDDKNFIFENEKSFTFSENTEGNFGGMKLIKIDGNQIKTMTYWFEKNDLPSKKKEVIFTYQNNKIIADNEYFNK